MSIVQKMLTTAALVVMSVSAAQAVQMKALLKKDSMPGWEQKGGAKQVWTVQDGVLSCSGEGGGWWGSKAEYTDFILELDFKVPAGGNSGVFLRATPTGDPAFTAFEVQILDDFAAQYKDILPAQHCGSVYKIAAPSKQVLKQAGEWNHMKITADGDHLIVEMNGEKIVDADGKTHPEILKRSPKGPVGFQNHHTGVSFRNIRFADLAADRKAASKPASERAASRPARRHR